MYVSRCPMRQLMSESRQFSKNYPHDSYRLHNDPDNFYLCRPCANRSKSNFRFLMYGAECHK